MVQLHDGRSVKINTKLDSNLEALILPNLKEGTVRLASKQKPSVFNVLVPMGYCPDFYYHGKAHDLFIEAKGRLFEKNIQVLTFLEPDLRKNIKFILNNSFSRPRKGAKGSMNQWLARHGYDSVGVNDVEYLLKLKRWYAWADGET